MKFATDEKNTVYILIEIEVEIFNCSNVLKMAIIFKIRKGVASGWVGFFT